MIKELHVGVVILASGLLSGGAAEEGFVSIFDGKTLDGWHVSAKTGHSRASKNESGGKWVIEDGAIVGSQDIPGNGGIVITDEKYGDFEVIIEMNNDFGPDSGLFLRSTEDGKAWQAMIDYHSRGNLMGVYGEGLQGRPSVRNYNFLESPGEIAVVTNTPVPLPVLPESWKYFWRHGQWNELRARIVGNPPHITTWINGVQIMEWKETEVRHPETGGIALQVHGGGNFTNQFVRYKNIRVKKIGPAGGADNSKAGKRTVAAGGGKYEITFDTSEAEDLQEWVGKQLIPVVQEWYPKIIELLPGDNYRAPERVEIIFSKDMRGVAAASGTRIRCSASWIRSNLDGEARGAVVHELVHVVQSYGWGRRNNPNATRTPGWIVEGIADYIRWFLYEPESKGAEITERNFARAKYDANYRITGNFLNWVVEKHGGEIITRLNATARAAKYTEDFWKEHTGKTVQELGDEWRRFHESKLGLAASAEAGQ